MTEGKQKATHSQHKTPASQHSFNRIYKCSAEHNSTPHPLLGTVEM